MNILGLSVFNDASAAVVVNGRVLAAVEEERLNRIKHYCGMPWLAIGECLDLAGLTLDDIDIVAIGWDIRLGWGTRIGSTLGAFLRNPGFGSGKVSRGGDYLRGCLDIIGLRRELSSRFSPSRPHFRIVSVPHHLAHAASAFLTSEYDRAGVMVADGIGESACVSLFEGRENRLTRSGEIPFPHSLGHGYASVTGFLGFAMTCDEGKVMALASFGEDRYHDLFADLVRVEAGVLRVDATLLDYHAARQGVFSGKWLRRTGLEPRRPGDPIEREHRDLACSLQLRIEAAVFALLPAKESPEQQTPFCAAGGLFLNSVLNGRIVREYAPAFYIQPAPGDNGVSLGAALYAGARFDPEFRRFPLRSAALGRRFSEDAVQSALKGSGTGFRKSPDIFSETADLIRKGNVVAWFRGRMEFGPRALGNRSILADPAGPFMKETLNARVKHREGFRPFAGSVLREDATGYFQDVSPSPFMLKVFHFRAEYRDRFPAINHVDGTCRLQTVTEADAPDLHTLLKRVKERTGHGMVLNTSLNVAGEPIVNTPAEALALLRKTGVDVLILEDYVIPKTAVS